jgi:adenylate cyclase
VFSGFYDDPSEDIGQLSPAFRPGSSQEDMAGYTEDDRRPSIASATTVSSTGSKSSVGRGIHKRLHHFFGEDLPSDGRQGSDTSLPPLVIYNTTSTADPRSAQTFPRNRTNSGNNTSLVPTISRPGSPSRPRTPHTSEVTPWEFQGYKVRRIYLQTRE